MNMSPRAPPPMSEGTPYCLTPPHPTISYRTLCCAFYTLSSHVTSNFRFLVGRLVRSEPREAHVHP